MDIHYGRFFGAASGFFEELGMYRISIWRLKDDLFGRNQLVGGILFGQPVLGQEFEGAAVERHDGRHGRALCRSADQRNGLSVAGHGRRPFQPGARRHDLHIHTVNGYFDDVAAVYVQRVFSGICGKDQGFPVGAEFDVFAHETAGGEE